MQQKSVSTQIDSKFTFRRRRAPESAAVDIRGNSVKKAPLHKKAPPIADENLLGGAFLVEHSAGGGNFWGFDSENDDFLKKNRVRKA